MKVRMITDSQNDDWKIGDEGIIQGYIHGDRPLVVLIIGDRIVATGFENVRVNK